MPKRSCCLGKIDRTMRSKWHKTTHMLNCNLDWWSLLTRSRVGLTLGSLSQAQATLGFTLPYWICFWIWPSVGWKPGEEYSYVRNGKEQRTSFSWVSEANFTESTFSSLPRTWCFSFTSPCPGFTKLHISLSRFTFMINQHFLILEYQIFKCCILFKKGKKDKGWLLGHQLCLAQTISTIHSTEM